MFILQRHRKAGIMQLGVKHLLSGMLIKHPNYKEKVVVESVVREKSVYGIYWRHLNSHSTGGFLTGVPDCGMIQIEDPTLQEVLKSAAILLNDVLPGWDLEHQLKTASYLIKERVSALTCASLGVIVEDLKISIEINLLHTRRAILLRATEPGDEGRLKL